MQRFDALSQSVSFPLPSGFLQISRNSHGRKQLAQSESRRDTFYPTQPKPEALHKKMTPNWPETCYFARTPEVQTWRQKSCRYHRVLDILPNSKLSLSHWRNRKQKTINTLLLHGNVVQMFHTKLHLQLHYDAVMMQLNNRKSREINGNQWLLGTKNIFKAAQVNIILWTINEMTLGNVIDWNKFQYCSSPQL